MADDVLKPVEPMPNDTVLVDLTDSLDTTPKKRKAEGEARQLTLFISPNSAHNSRRPLFCSLVRIAQSAREDQRE